MDTAITIITLIFVGVVAIFLLVFTVSLLRSAFLADTDATAFGREDNFPTKPTDEPPIVELQPDNSITLWLAMDDDDDRNLYAFASQPFADDGVWTAGRDRHVIAVFPAALFPQVTFANSPKRIGINLINEQPAE